MAWVWEMVLARMARPPALLCRRRYRTPALPRAPPEACEGRSVGWRLLRLLRLLLLLRLRLLLLLLRLLLRLR